MSKVAVCIPLPAIEGFEYTGEYRAPRIGEWYLDPTDCKAPKECLGIYNARLILKKKITRRPVTKDDIGRLVRAPNPDHEYKLLAIDGDTAWVSLDGHPDKRYQPAVSGLYIEE